MPKPEDEDDDMWSGIKSAIASTFDPAVQAKEEIVKRAAERGGMPSQYEQDLASGQAKKRFQKGFSGN